MEIKELQEELAGVLYSIDKILKHNIMVQTKLTAELQKSLFENMSLNIQYNVLNNIAKLQAEGKSKEEIKNLLKPLKNNLGKQVRNLNNQLRMARDIKAADGKYTFADVEAFENEYSLFLRTYHPLITLTGDQINITTFNMLRQFYMINNIEAFKGVKAEHPITVHPISNEEQAVKRLSDTLKLYKEQLNKLETDEKFKKMEDVLKDESLIAREEAALRQQNYKIKEKVNTLKDNVSKMYPEGYDDLLK